MKMDSPCTTVSKESVLDCTDSGYRVCEESGLDDLHRPQLVKYLKNLGLKTQNACVPLTAFCTALQSEVPSHEHNCLCGLCLSMIPSFVVAY